ncbi:glycosyltransferase family 2 protein [Microbacterium sp. ZKA21]|uniref:glycosyltransferase family 2 protein n=1 Tax=Microbacterium sp. ZKA21 TaxID=3381694 RepID=UPI003D1E60A1
MGITTYERPGALRRAIRSILEQEKIDAGTVELVVVDDASQSEPAVKYLESIKDLSSESISVRLLRHADGTGGPSVGRNEIIDAATGDYVLFLDDDNSIFPGTLNLVVAHLSTTSADWVSLRRHRNGKSFFRAPESINENLTRAGALWTLLIAGAFRRTALLESGIRFDPAISYGEDNEFVLQFVTHFTRFTAMSDRDYLLEGDPLSGELPHISHLRPGAEFVQILVAHVGRLFGIIADANLSDSEADTLAAIILNRATGSYNLHRKIAGLADDGVVRQFLLQWSAAISRVLTTERAVELASKRDLDRVMRAVFSADVQELRESVRSLA